MKTRQEIEQLANEEYKDNLHNPFFTAAPMGYIKGYEQCQEDNDWTKNCECESSIGQTWCCNQCGLPYDTRKSDKKYTEKQLLDAMSFAECYIIEHDKPLFLKSDGKPTPDCLEYINSLNK